MKPDRPDPFSPLCPLSRLGPLCPLRRQPTNGPNGQNGPNRLNGLNGQAMIELAIFGSFAILALGFLIQIGLRQNFQQEIEQTAFRRALVLAQEEDMESQSIQYNYFRNRRLPNPADGFGVTPRSLTQAGATVTWGEWLTYLTDDRDSQPRIIVSLDDQDTIDARSEDFPEGEPLVKHIHKDLSGSAQIGQVNSSGLSSASTSSSSENTTLTLSSDATAQSTMDTTISRDWRQ